MNQFNPDLKYIGEVLSGAKDPSTMAELISHASSQTQQGYWKLYSDSQIKAATALLPLAHVEPSDIEIRIRGTDKPVNSSRQLLSDCMKTVTAKPFRGELVLRLYAYLDSYTPADDIINNLESAK